MKGGETAEVLPVPSRFPYCLDKGSFTFTVQWTPQVPYLVCMGMYALS